MPDTKEQKAYKRYLRKLSDPLGTKRRQKNENLKHNFGITIEQYEDMFERQGGLCGICQVHQKYFKRSLAVDHDHHTGSIRGLLCDSCNSGIGKLQDSVEMLERAKLYLIFGPAFLTRVEREPNVPEVER